LASDIEVRGPATRRDPQHGPATFWLPKSAWHPGYQTGRAEERPAITALLKLLIPQKQSARTGHTIAPSP
jgi:hypothetical protein